MTPQALYDRPTEHVTYDLDDLHGFRFDHVQEADIVWWSMSPNKRVTVRTIEYHVFPCGRRIWFLATVWLDARPVMVVQNAGREGDDHATRFITDSAAFYEMIAYLHGLVQRHLIFTVEATSEIAGLDDFYNHKLGERWT